MREYILEKVRNTPRYFSFGGIEVEQVDDTPDDIDVQKVLSVVERHFPRHYFQNLDKVRIEHLEEFDERNVTAVYQDGIFYITNKQQSEEDLLDDVIHEFAHHIESLYTQEIYGDQAIQKEFLKKREQLKFELRSEGYWTDDYDFRNLKFDEKFDDFLYKRVGKTMLRMVTSGLFVRPYGSVSLREYFATGFEAYYLGKQEELQKISPVLYSRINEIHNLNN